MADEKDIAHLREFVLARFEAEKEARLLAYQELQRRLDVLNHAHDNMAMDRAQFLRIETHDRFYQEFKEWKETVNKTLATQAGRAGAYVTIVGGLWAIVQIAIHYWR
jgi:hypothetical protein